MKDDQLYLIHILECIEKIEAYTKAGRSFVASTPMAQDAIVRNFEIIGEAAKKISPKLREKHPAIPWKQIAGFRDVLIHNYMGINFEEVWEIVANHLPDLKKQVSALLQPKRA